MSGELDVPGQGDLSALRAELDKANTPAEYTAVLDMADAIQNRARRFRVAFAKADLLDAARAVYSIGIDAAFARLDTVCRIADQLPRRGEIGVSRTNIYSAEDYGISGYTAMRWKQMRDEAASRDIQALRAEWLLLPAADPKDWREPTFRRILYQPAQPVQTPPPPDGRYRTLVIDPPWQMERLEREIAYEDGGPGLAYTPMAVDEIEDLPVGDWAADGCHIYLWVTHRYLPAGLRILEAWGARYQCVMTWRKNLGMTPFSWMYDTEHVLFAQIGSLPLQQVGLRLSFDADRTGHSVKPDVFYDRVMAASPEPRLEMFARQARDGFTPWGAEAPS